MVKVRLRVRENRIVNGNKCFGPHLDSKTNVCVYRMGRLTSLG